MGFGRLPEARRAAEMAEDCIGDFTVVTMCVGAGLRRGVQLPVWRTIIEEWHRYCLHCHCQGKSYALVVFRLIKRGDVQ